MPTSVHSLKNAEKFCRENLQDFPPYLIQKLAVLLDETIAHTLRQGAHALLQGNNLPPEMHVSFQESKTEQKVSCPACKSSLFAPVENIRGFIYRCAECKQCFDPLQSFKLIHVEGL